MRGATTAAVTARSTQRRRRVAMFSTPWDSKFQRLRPLISDLVRDGLEVHVFTDRRFAAEIEQAGGRFVDLFGAYPVEAVDDESIPLPCRHVTFAAAYAEPIAADLERLGPGLVVHDSFSVIGSLVARILDIPRVASCAGHYVDPPRAVERYGADVPPSISPACHRAVDTLRETYKLEDASPFAYLSNLSPLLNLYGEPPEFLSPAEREALEPVAFYGSLPALEEIESRRHGDERAWHGCRESDLKIYVAFGSYVWRYWPREVLDAFACISAAVAEMPNVSALIGLGGAQLEPDAARELCAPNVAVGRYVDQWQALAEADVFITHHGVYSTHEAIFSCVPMLGYPFFADQPALAARCEELGLSVPLVESPRRPLTGDRVRAAVECVTRQRESMCSQLAQARQWELRMLEGRDEIVRRIRALIPR